MNKLSSPLIKTAFIATLLFSLSACDSNDGPLESAGQKIDKAATDMGNAIEDTCEEAKEGMGAKDTDC